MFSFRQLVMARCPAEPSGEAGAAPSAPHVSTSTPRPLQSSADLPVPLGLLPLGDTDRVLLTPTHATRLRSQITRAVQIIGWHGERLDALLDAAEAIANAALGHGVGGELQLRTCSVGQHVQVWVRDRGQGGETSLSLQQAVSACDQVSFLSDAEGTIWVIEQTRTAPGDPAASIPGA